eukprot:CAMPEP_0174273176 /NCGR_PEP_ID=MMETSP0439-20130205/53693_1 /TAXON_ID=0 /ORGANISM="Stereomyxa ramosa, Strain Chinc5" /LENGTH=31 /DNA_ID= /DNA_START= /DNA_END= /DNA_ORIENTATION=
MAVTKCPLAAIPLAMVPVPEPKSKTCFLPTP